MSDPVALMAQMIGSDGPKPHAFRTMDDGGYLFHNAVSLGNAGDGLHLGSPARQLPAKHRLSRVAHAPSAAEHPGASFLDLIGNQASCNLLDLAAPQASSNFLHLAATQTSTAFLDLAAAQNSTNLLDLAVAQSSTDLLDLAAAQNSSNFLDLAAAQTSSNFLDLAAAQASANFLHSAVAQGSCDPFHLAAARAFHQQPMTQPQRKGPSLSLASSPHSRGLLQGLDSLQQLPAAAGTLSDTFDPKHVPTLPLPSNCNLADGLEFLAAPEPSATPLWSGAFLPAQKAISLLARAGPLSSAQQEVFSPALVGEFLPAQMELRRYSARQQPRALQLWRPLGRLAVPPSELETSEILELLHEIELQEQALQQATGKSDSRLCEPHISLTGTTNATSGHGSGLCYPKSSSLDSDITADRNNLYTELPHQGISPLYSQNGFSMAGEVEGSRGATAASPEEKRQRRLAGNREAARRLRKRHAEKLDEMESRMTKLQKQHCETMQKLEEAEARIAELTADNARLEREALDLRLWTEVGTPGKTM